MRTLLLCIGFCFLLNFNATAKRQIDSVQFVLEDKDRIENDRFQYGFKVFFSNGKIKKTRGFLRGSFARWKIEIRSDQIKRSDIDVLIIDHEQIRRNKDLLELNVRVEKGLDVYEFKVFESFPSLDSVYLLNRMLYPYQDNKYSILGLFSNGKTYVISDEKDYPGLRLSQIRIEEEVPIERNGLTFKYQPEWGNLLVETPVCLGILDWQTEQYLYCNYGVNVQQTRLGMEGEDGHKGENGNDASEDGYNGGDAGTGWNGGHGQAPDDLFVFVAEKDELFWFLLVQGNWETQYILSRQGKLRVENKGGPGGKGGTGGEGGDGADSSDEYDPGEGGKGGDGGSGGDGGQGGNIYVYHDIDPLLATKLVEAQAPGGVGGAGGAAGKGGKDGWDHHLESALAGFITNVLIKGRGPKGSYGKSGKSGENGKVVYDCMNDAEYRMIHEKFGVELD